MIDIALLRSIQAKIICIGSHKSIIQSMLDFDFLSGKDKPNIKAIIASGRRFERYFFANKEILIPVFDTIEKIPDKIISRINLFFNTTSARRAKSTTIELFDKLPNIQGGTIFAEDVPEKHSLELSEYIISRHAELVSASHSVISEIPKQVRDDMFIIGPASVGLIMPGNFKIGAIGGTDYRQLIESDVMTAGNVAVLSASGGMVNELIRVVAQQGKHLSFALSFGGDRFPVLSPKDALLSAQEDPLTETIVFYGELGGDDEYEIVKLLKNNRLRKTLICFIAGTVSDLFETPPQFGHAKAMAKLKGEGARDKREALKKAGAIVPETFADFVASIAKIPSQPKTPNNISQQHKYAKLIQIMRDRKPALITTSVSDEVGGDAMILGEKLLDFVGKKSFAAIVVSMFLGKKEISEALEQFVDLVLRLAVDHGPYVSGAVNTIVTARAGRDMVSSLSAGLLTIGPRFGGAANQAAVNWLNGVNDNKTAYDFIEEFASKKIYIQGIGHRKYRIDHPDPRVTELLKHTHKLLKKRFTNFALEVQKITTAKKGNLILNVDGAIAAILLDILSEKEGFSDDELKTLTDIEFFNSLFVLSRSVGFISHFLDQKRLDEGLFRLPEDLVAKADQES